GSVAPGEMLTIYGFGAGSVIARDYMLDASGLVATTLNGAEVLFDGQPAPMVYESLWEAKVIVPYEVAARATNTIALSNGGLRSMAWTVPVEPAAPGIFAINGAGVGQATVLNEDNTVNGPANPAPIGTMIRIFGTGEGQTSPPGVTGGITGS